jgi:tRNA A-37 threonylcarbamoyl transferase component Bud32
MFPTEGDSHLPELEDYEILEQVGSGGMGIVYKARHRQRNRIVALKIIRKDRLSHPEAVARFRREAVAAARLSHPNIVLLFDSDAEGDVHYLAMEYVNGVTLQEVVDSQGPLPINQAHDFLRQAALGLQHAHEQKLIHRDVKPSNLMVTGNVLKILDMGVARLHQLQNAPEETITTLTQHGTVIGTPDFIAPEQLENPHGADIRADLYSLGCTAYFILSGKVPFDGGTLIQKLDRQRWEVPPSVEQLRPEIPAALGAVVRRLMAKKPDERFQTPGELADALEELTRTGAIAALAKRAPLMPAARLIGHRDAVASLCFLGDSKHLASGGRDRSLRVWTVAEGREVRRQDMPREVKALAVKPQGASLLVAAGVTLRLIDAMTGEDQQRLSGHLDAVRALAFSADGKWIASGSDDRTVRLWDGQTGRPVQRLAKHVDVVTGVSFAPDGKALLSSGRDQLLVEWEAPGGRLGREYAVPRGAVTGVVVCPDGRHIVSAHFDTTLRLWDRETGREMRRLQGHRQMVTAVACSSAGVLASAGNDRVLRLWDMESGAETAHGEGHEAAITCVTFAPDDRLVATGGADGVICLWKVGE